MLWALVAMASLTVLTRSLVQTYHIEGSSMQPTFDNGQRLVIERLAYLAERPRRGEVVVFHAPTSPDQDFIKRVIGLPGERVLVKSGQVYVNGQRLDEPYVQNLADYTYPADGQALSVPPDAYFVLGDNRPVSFDSHAGWFVRADQLVGRAAVSIWPPSTWGAVPQPAVARLPVEEQLPSKVPAPPVPSPIAPPTGPRTVLDERFSALSPAWPNDPGSAWFANPGFQLAARRPGEFVAISAPLTDRPADVVVSGTFRKVGGPAGGGYGLIVRSQEPSTLDGRRQVGHYYVAEVGDKGEVGIWRRDGDHWVDLQPWTPSAAVRPGDGINELTLSARGTQLEFAVNGISVASVAGATLPAGGVGVFVGGDLNQILLERLLVQTTS
jgi:signal peptidase I